MNSLEQTVLVVDDDASLRDSLAMLLESVGLPFRLYETANDLLEDLETVTAGCLVLDIRMPGMSGLDLRKELVRRGIRWPVIFMTGHGDIVMAVKAMRAGAFDFIAKPFREQDLLDSIRQALEFGAKEQRLVHDRDELREKIESLSDRERQVFSLVAEGLTNRMIACDLSVSERTVEVHRSSAMKKIGAKNLAELVRISIEADQSPQRRSSR